jgi:FkbM family methyltransferase
LDKLLGFMADDESKNYLVSLIDFRRTLDPSLLQGNKRQVGFYEYRTPKEQIKDNSTLVDCGAFTGDTAEIFSRRANVKKIYAIEGIAKNYNHLIEWAKKNQSTTIVPMKYFLGKEIGSVEFFLSDNSVSYDPRATYMQTSLEGERHSERVQVSTLDSLFLEKDEKIDLIKIDVEGADLDVLLGGRDMLLKQTPDLMIASYHRLEHMWEIPTLLKTISQEYKIYAGHHDRCIHEIEYYCQV